MLTDRDRDDGEGHRHEGQWLEWDMDAYLCIVFYAYCLGCFTLDLWELLGLIHWFEYMHIFKK